MVNLKDFLPTISWNSLAALLALGLVLYGAWSLWRYHKRQDLFAMLLGLYLAALQLPLAIPALGQAFGVTCPLSGDLPSKLVTVAPAAALFLLASWDGRSTQEEVR